MIACTSDKVKSPSGANFMSLVEQSIVYQSGNRQIDGYLVRPEGEGLFPGVVVIHEAFGLNENIKEVARRFADSGYMALAVDLFSGRNAVLCMFRLISGVLFDSLNHEGIRNQIGRAHV